MTTPSGVLSRILGGSTHSGSSLCSEYAPLGAVSMGCHSGSAESYAARIICFGLQSSMRANINALCSAHHSLKSVIFHLLHLLEDSLHQLAYRFQHYLFLEFSCAANGKLLGGPSGANPSL